MIVLTLSSLSERRVGLTTLAATITGVLPVRVTAAEADKTAIRPFTFTAPEKDLVELRRRVQATAWPDRETVPDASQGVQLATIQALARYWATDYDWRKVEAKLNALPQFITEIDGLDIHFVHVRSKHKNALPVIVTHGWPGSILEQLKIIDPLVNPTAYGGLASDAFDVVIPSMPGYGFSGKPTTTGWGPERMGRAWHQLMTRLGYTRYVAQGGDWGAFVVDQMGLQAPAGLLGIHTNLPAIVPADVYKPLLRGEPPPAGLSAEERRAYRAAGDNSQARRIRPDHGVAAADPVRHRGLAGRPGRLAARPRRCRRAAGRGHDCRTAPHPQHERRADARGDPGQHHPVLGDEHRCLGVASLLGIQGRLLGRQGRQHPGRGERVSRRAISSAAELDRASVSEAHLLQRARQGRPLRGVGTAAALRLRGARRLQVVAQVAVRDRGQGQRARSARRSCHVLLSRTTVRLCRRVP